MYSYFGSIISDCKSICEDKNTTILFVKRSADNVAHTLVEYLVSLLIMSLGVLISLLLCLM